MTCVGLQNLTAEQKYVASLVIGSREGLTRQHLSARTGLSDRAVRQIIEELVCDSALPVICDRGDTGREEGRYRIAGAGPDEVERVNRELQELTSRGLAALRRAKGLRTAYQQQHQAGALFLADVPEVPT